jgi:enamine deaminase RidA (YjgF/YER057c/UK114 family)
MFRMNFLGAVIRCAAAAVAAAGLSACMTDAHKSDVPQVVRLPLPPGNNFPIASAVTVKAGADMYFLSGALAPSFTGDTETQTVGALTSIKATLGRLGLGMGDVIKMTVFLVGDPSKDNKMDFKGLMAGYTQFFGTAEQPNLPARSAFQVAALAAPGALVEIEVVAAKSH